MNSSLTLSFLLLSLVWATDNPRAYQDHINGAADRDAFVDDTYNLDLELELLENDRYRIVATMELDSGSWFVSPYCADKYSGHFSVTLKDNENLYMDNAFVETPGSVAQFDCWKKGMGNFVTESTSYTYDLTVNSKDDFKVLGMVRFVIEPKCTLEEIPFSISSQGGKLTIQQYPKLDKTTCTKKI